MSFPYIFFYDFGPFASFDMTPNLDVHCFKVYHYCWSSGESLNKLRTFQLLVFLNIFLPLLLVFLFCYGHLTYFLWIRNHRTAIDNDKKKKRVWNESLYKNKLISTSNKFGNSCIYNMHIYFKFVLKTLCIKVNVGLPSKLLIASLSFLPQLIKILGAIIVVFFVSRFPGWLFMVIKAYDDVEDVGPLDYPEDRLTLSYVNHSLQLLTMLSPTINPLLYVMIHPMYNQYLPRFFRRKTKKMVLVTNSPNPGALVPRDREALGGVPTAATVTPFTDLSGPSNLLSE